MHDELSLRPRYPRIHPMLMTLPLRSPGSHCARLAVCLLALTLGGPVAAQTDADFLAAKAAFDRGDRGRLAAVAPKLATHVLAPYVTYWQLKLAIDETPPETVRAFVERHAGSPLADRLRVDWLKSLGKRGKWSLFAIDFPPPQSDDVELACYGIQYRWQRDGDEALAAAKPLWFTGQGTPDACEPLFAALIRRGDLSTADRLARVRLAVEAGNLRTAQSIAGDLAGKDRMAEREFADATRDPLRTLTKGQFAYGTAAGRELALAALERAARADAADARVPWVKLRDRLPEADRQYGNARLGFHAARQHLPAANDWFREAGAVVPNAETQAWRVRAALRAVAWDDVITAVDAMEETQQQEAAWRYWRARGLAEKGRRDDAAAAYGALARETHFYGILAGEAIGQRFAPPASTTVVPAPEAIAAFAARPEVKRVLKLAELELRIEMLREWQYIVRGLDDDALLLAAEHARRVGLYDRAINTAERTASRHDYAQRYLAPFRPHFDTAAKAHDVDVAMLYGIARQESRFIPGIVSSAGAVGLMQLMPGTARWVAKQVGRRDYSPALIADTELNTDFGAFYFKYWFERLDRMPALAAAAYNAGPRRAQAWRPDTPLEGAIWVETIPFNETRDYVKKVLANAVVYGHALDGASPALTVTLGVVQPRGGSATNVTAAARN
jgi:soluble lytic murein transglycosylase